MLQLLLANKAEQQNERQQAVHFLTIWQKSFLLQTAQRLWPKHRLDLQSTLGVYEGQMMYDSYLEA